MPRAKPRPPWGQHFLRDRKILDKIVASLPIEPGSLVIEIGPGHGALTRPLVERGARVVAIEIDARLVKNLREKFEGFKEVEIVLANILTIDLSGLIEHRSKEPVLVVGNLPYYITSPILKRTFTLAGQVSEAVFLIQEEVGRRVVAKAGDTDYGFLSVLCQIFSEPEQLFVLPAEVFHPRPRVRSALVRFSLKSGEDVEEGFIEFVQRCFHQPRKTLFNNLAVFYGRDLVLKVIARDQRAHELSVDDFRQLWKNLESSKLRNYTHM